MPKPPQFVMATCQVGAEEALKGELSRRWPDFRLAYSRPGFLTFKLPAEHKLLGDFDLGCVFARSWAFSLGKIEGGDSDNMAARVWDLHGERPMRRLHVWQRDAAPPGGKLSQSPPITPEVEAAYEALWRCCPHPEIAADDARDRPRPFRRGEFVLDCVLVEPGQWWIGYHRVGTWASQWPGGRVPLTLPAEAVSRAWLKMEESLLWSRLPIPRGARCAEIGSAPGGASQALLGRGMTVLGIDPAEMAPIVADHPRFTHLRRRSTQVRRREFRKIRWLMADMNVAPRYTLDAVEDIVMHPEVNIRGMLLTLKLSDWKLADVLPDYLGRIAGWGYNVANIRQLFHSGREVCVAALKKPFRRKPVHPRHKGALPRG